MLAIFHVDMLRRSLELLVPPRVSCVIRNADRKTCAILAAGVILEFGKGAVIQMKEAESMTVLMVKESTMALQRLEHVT